MREKFNLVLRGKILSCSKRKISNIIRKHLMARNESKSVFIQLENKNSRLISHAPLGEPQFMWPWPISILQWIFICSLDIYEFSSSGEKIFEKQFLFKDFNKAVNILLEGITEDCIIQLQGRINE